MYLAGYSIKAGIFFYRGSERRSCYWIDRWMRVYYAVKPSCLVRRLNKHSVYNTRFNVKEINFRHMGEFVGFS
jgi:hypothetical protein